MFNRTIAPENRHRLIVIAGAALTVWLPILLHIACSK
jgi:hypothetical protein